METIQYIDLSEGAQKVIDSFEMSNKSPSLPMREGAAMRLSQCKIACSISWTPRVAWVKAGCKSFLVKSRDRI